MESQLGDLGRFRTDIEKNVEDAFEQAKRADRYINKAQNPEFTEIDNGRKLSIDKNTILRTYLLTISQHHLAGIACQLAMVQDLGLFRDQEYPFSICIADLETISEFFDGPEVFLHYIEKRLKIQREHLDIEADEPRLFGAYLSTRLQADKIWLKDGKPVDFVVLADFHIKFDEWMEYKRGERRSPPSIKLNVPDEISLILSELRKRDDNEARWIAFALLDMSDGTLDVIIKFLKDLRVSKLTPGKFRTAVFQEGETVISVIGSIDLPPERLQKKTARKALVEKYRRKALRSFGIGVMVTDTARPFECAVWAEGKWEYDTEMERVLESEPVSIPAPGQKIPSRNAPCFCGSDKKFKKCCLPKIEAARKNDKLFKG